jgi:hypothetical protein
LQNSPKLFLHSEKAIIFILVYSTLSLAKALKSLARFHNPIARHLISRYKSKRRLLVLENMLLENRFFIAQASLEPSFTSELLTLVNAVDPADIQIVAYRSVRLLYQAAQLL